MIHNQFKSLTSVATFPKEIIISRMQQKIHRVNKERFLSNSRIRKQLSSTTSRHRELSGYMGSEELHHQQGDPQGDEKCKIM